MESRIKKLEEENQDLRRELENKNRESRQLKKMLKAFDRVSLFSQKEILAQEETIQAFETAEELSRKERLEMMETLEAYEKVVSLTAEEKKELYAELESYEKAMEMSGKEKKELLSLLSAFEISSDLSTAERQAMQQKMARKLEILGRVIRELSGIYSMISEQNDRFLDSALNHLNDKNTGKQE